jgi:hypothetical protein
MKKNLLLICSLFVFFFASAQTDTLTNETVIKLHQAGFGQEVIKSKINTSPAKFDVSIDAMMKLKESKVPEEVITMMVSNPGGNAAKNTASTGTTTTATDNRPSAGTGIYLIKSSTETVEVNPSYINSKKTDRTAQFLVSGLVDADIRVILNEPKATLQTSNLPKFQFVFDTIKNNNENQWFGKNSTPKNFFLVKLKPTKKTRELIIGTTSALQDQIEIKEKQKIQLKSKKTGPGVWEVSPVTALEPGEYGIVFSNAIWDTQSGKIYDFSVSK